MTRTIRSAACFLTSIAVLTIAALLAGWPAVADAADGSIVGWGSQVVGVDLSADFVAVAAGG